MDSIRQKASQLARTRPVLALLLGIAAIWAFGSASAQPQNSPNSPSVQQPSSAAPVASSQTPAPAIPRGKKLMLKDGTFQLVREYHVEGDRVRYYSIDQRDWDEIPESLVDWDATRKMEIGEAKKNLDLVAVGRKTEKMRNAELIAVDAIIKFDRKDFSPA